MAYQESDTFEADIYAQKPEEPFLKKPFPVKRKKMTRINKIIENFHPSWFVATMSWGAQSYILTGLPFTEKMLSKSTWVNLRSFLEIFSKIIWAWNFFYWVVFVIIFTVQFRKHKKSWQDPQKAIFFSCAVIGFSVILLGFSLLFKLPDYSFYLWWVNVVLAILAIALLNTKLFLASAAKQNPVTQSTILLPALPSIVAAATGASITPTLDSLNWQISTIFTSYFLLGMGYILALALMTIYLGRLMMYGRPGAAIGNSVWILLGPIGHGTNTILQLARHSQNLPSWTAEIENFKLTVQGVSFLIGLLSWGFGIFLVIAAAVCSMSHCKIFGECNEGLPFNLGYWAIIFPIATYTFATFQLTIYTQMTFFVVMSWVIGLSCFYISVFVHIKTFQYIIFKSKKFWHVFE